MTSAGNVVAEVTGQMIAVRLAMEVDVEDSAAEIAGEVALETADLDLLPEETTMTTVEETTIEDALDPDQMRVDPESSVKAGVSYATKRDTLREIVLSIAEAAVEVEVVAVLVTAIIIAGLAAEVLLATLRTAEMEATIVEEAQWKTVAGV